MRRKCWRPSSTTLFRQSAVPWASFTNCQKKGGFPNPSPYDASSPHRREPIEDDGKYLGVVAITTKRRWCEATKKKEGSLVPPPMTHSPLPKKVERMLAPLRTCCHP